MRFFNNILVADWLLTPVKHSPLFYGFVRQEIKGRFAGSILGMFWSVLAPLSIIFIYLFVFSAVLRIKMSAVDTGTGSFAVYLLAGLLPWMIFAESLTRATSSLLEHGSIISKVSFPVQVLPWSLVTSSFLVNGAGLLVFILVLFARGKAHASWILLPFLFACLYLFTLGLSALLASLTVFVRDLREVVIVGLQLWFYATPIVYPLSMVPDRFSFVLAINPILPFIHGIRQCLLQGRLWSGDYALCLLFAAVSCLVGGFCFLRLRPAFGDVL